MKVAKTIISVACVIVCVSAILSGCGVQQGSTNPSSNGQQQSSKPISLSTASSEVQSLYKARCISCHAIDLSGKMGEQTNLQQIYKSLSYDDIVATITNGGEVMQPFKDKLSEQEINSLAAWLSKQ